MAAGAVLSMENAMTRSSSAPAVRPRTDRRPDLSGWQHELFLSALTGGFSLSLFDALFDRMERQP
ncbi:MAG: hypothetical protein DI533_09915 [Cereibacter sphaeroides]|uniref:Uncharacterized protein n=1 Tax=Cereibacter sphaeroides TaxID=1063 RepID=A0A2W5SMH8_CERSP|nr:MAG: hypothetical protein DI533_09915 [Cereibacter sphaeroides]